MLRCVVLVAGLLLLLGSSWGSRARRRDNSIVMTMIVRDEAVNLRDNLPLWRGVVDYYIFLLDTRTGDDSEKVIRDILDPQRVSYEIIPNEFDGFGASRTRSLESAWRLFPQAGFVWIADPDWKPDVFTIHKQQLTPEYDAFRFKIIDRSGITTRQCDWLLTHREGLAMRYHLHEVLDIGSYTPVNVDWVVHEVEQPGSWHTTVGHENSFAAKRSLFDLDLLYKDLEQYGHDPHTHKYLGVTHLGYVMDVVVKKSPEGSDSYDFSTDAVTDEVADHFEKGKYFCELRANPDTVYDEEFAEERWDCMLQLALASSVLGKMDEAEKWYVICHEFTPSEPRCMYSLASLLDQTHQVNEAYHYLQTLLTMKTEARHGINFRAMATCLIPKLAISVLLKYANENIDYPVSIGFMQYIRMLMRMIREVDCVNFVGSQGEVERLGDIIDAMSVLMGVSLSSDDYITLCYDPALRNFLQETQYRVHAC